jgi:hypothetical protein
MTQHNKNDKVFLGALLVMKSFYEISFKKLYIFTCPVLFKRNSSSSYKSRPILSNGKNSPSLEYLYT